jgi:hypoxanthine phosphoribosyltransferase
MGDLREHMTWDDLGAAVGELAKTIHTDGFRPDAVLALARGGLPLAGALAYALGVKNMATLNVEFYTGVAERLEEPLLLPPVPDLTLLRADRLLVVDDVADTGRTLALVSQFCAEHVAEVRTAVLYEKPHSVVRSDYVWRRTDRWVNFPWSAPVPVSADGAEVTARPPSAPGARGGSP